MLACAKATPEALQALRLILDNMLAAMLTVMRDLYGEAFAFRRIRLRYPAPSLAGACP